MSIEIHGFCDERFAPLRDAFVANFDAGLELGASLGVTHEGRDVVNLWAGFANPKRTRIWAENTIVQVMSATKIVANIAALIAVDRGLLALDAPVAQYWPAFAQGGKQAVTLRDVLTHRAGVPGLYPPAPFEVVKDWAAITARIAAEPHWFGGARRSIYHSTTYGYIIAELIRRTDGRGPRQFFSEEITGPAGADFPLGVTTEEDFARIAPPLVPTADPPSFKPDELMMRVMRSMEFGADLRATFAIEHPGGLGFANGRSLARVCAILANGGALDGVRYLSEGMAAQAGEEQCYEDFPSFGPMRFGLGFALNTKEYPMPSHSFYHWGGVGGSIGMIDPVSRISLGYAPNNWTMTGDGDGPSPGRVETRQGRFVTALEKVLPSL